MTRSRSDNPNSFTQNIAKFTYTSRRQQEKPERTRSYATIEMNDKTQYAYRKTMLLGAGAYGVVALMEPDDKTIPPLVVKEIYLGFHQNFNKSKLITGVINTHKIAQHEKKMYRQISKENNGFAMLYQSNEPLQVEMEGGEYVLTSYQHNYILMDFIDKPLFNKVKIDSQNDLIDLFIETLNALQLIHDKNIVHGDIKSANVFAWKNEEGRYVVRFIDMSLSKYIGENIDIIQDTIYPPQFPPEYSYFWKPLLAHPKQDIYSLGIMLDQLLKRKWPLIHLSDDAEKEIGALLSDMVSSDPKSRPSIKSLLKKIAIIKKSTSTCPEDDEQQLEITQSIRKNSLAIKTQVIKNDDKSSIISLCGAARNGDLDAVKRLLKHDSVSISERNKYGYTALLLAAKNNHLEMVKWLLKHGGASINEKNKYGYTALLLAAKNNHLEMVKWLLNHGGASINEKNKYGYTALLLASKKNHLEMVKWLLKHGGASINEKNNHGKTAQKLTKDPKLQEYLKVKHSKQRNMRYFLFGNPKSKPETQTHQHKKRKPHRVAST